MDVTDITPDLNKLDSQLDKLEEVMKPLLGDMSEVASQLPLLDRAKLFVLATYTIESLLFSALKIQGVDAQKHPVFTELKRVQQYFAKIKALEEPPEPPEPRPASLNTEVAARIIKAEIGSNSKEMKNKLAEQIAKERAKALLKSMEGGKRESESSASSRGGSKKRKQDRSSLSERPKSTGET